MAQFDKGYALVIGVANYPNVRKLPATVLKDATDLSALLMDAAQCGYPPDQIRHLLDEQATADNIRTELRWLAKETGIDDTVVFFFSGHGGRIETGAQAGNYLIPVDTDPADIQKTAIESAELTELLRDIRARRLLVLFDCCHAGGTGEIKDFLDETIPNFKAGLDERYYDQLAMGQGRVIIAASRSTEVSWILPGMENSLFTHYLLEALRGQARTYDDGLIRILDVFNFIAEAVPKRQPEQHPILKAKLETNFPVALYLGGEQPHHNRQARPIIEHLPDLSLPPEARAVLKAMFADYERVLVKEEFTGGFGGGRVFLVRPIRANNVPELPAVVKMGSISLIEKEWRAYQNYIRDRLPKNIGMKDKPVVPSGYWGGLCYPMVGNGTFAIESLRDYCRATDLENIRFVLAERLLKIIEQLMQFNRAVPAFHLQASYDPLLPLNLLIRPIPVPAGIKPHEITPEALPDVPLKKGDHVRLAGFVVTKVDVLNDTVTLDLPASPDAPPASYRIRLKSVGTMASYQVNQIIEPVEGVVIQTRQERLEAEAGRALGAGFEPTRETLTLPDGSELPNPLLAWPTILSQYPDVKVGAIHGDLNMENVLVDVATREVGLIDFAEAREDHLLHDFLRLETEVVTKLVPEILAKANLGAGVIRPFYEQLHQVVVHAGQPDPGTLPHPTLEKPLAMLVTIRQAARKYLFNPDDWTEYYRSLVIYLLGALKFKNLDEMAEAPAPLPKQVAFWGAATVGELVKNLVLTPSKQKETLMQTKNQSTPSEKTAQHPVSDHSAKVTYRDFFSPLEIGLEQLLDQMGQDHPRYSDFLIYKQRLTENIKRSRRFGNTSDRQAERVEIIDQLNELALSVVGISFNDL